MVYVAPMVSGVVLFGVIIMSMLLKIDIQAPVMMLLALAGVLLSLPAIKKFQFTKDGFSIEASEPDYHQTTTPHGTQAVSPDKVRPNVTGDGKSLQWRMVPRALGLLYGAISGVLSASFGWQGAFTLRNGEPYFNSSWPAPLLPAIFYSLALFAQLVPFRSVNKISILVLPLIVFVAWIAGFQISMALFRSHTGFEISGMAGGIAGAFLLSIGLCIFAKEARSLKAILAITAVGGIIGAMLAVPVPKLTPSSTFPVFGALFITWQGAVSLAIAFFMTISSKGSDPQKAQ